MRDEMLEKLTTEGRNPASERLDEMSALEIVELMNDEDARVIPAVRAEARRIAEAVEIIADRLRAGGRLVYVGAGTSGRLGVLDAAECPPTFSSDPRQVVGLIAGGLTALTQAVEGAEDEPAAAIRDLEQLGLSSGDVLVGIATSGRTPYVLSALRYARGQRCFTIGLSCNPQSAVRSECDLAITPVVGPEVVSGSTRLKAGTATKLVLNSLTTGAMVLLGKTYGNLMVDLTATNSKLFDRTRRIVCELTGVDGRLADEALRDCSGELKTAVVMLTCGLSAESARERLRGADGHLRSALHGESDAAEPV